MPFVIDSIIDEKRLVVVKRTLAFAKAFYHPISKGLPLTQEHITLIPSTIIIEKPDSTPLLDVIEVSGVWLISERVRALIVQIEPDAHEFIAIDRLESEAGTKWHGYSLLRIGQSVDAIIIDKTSFRDGEGRAGFSIAPVLNTIRERVTLNRNRIEGMHLWRGGSAVPEHAPDPFSGYTFCSDEFESAISASNVQGWRFLRCELGD